MNEKNVMTPERAQYIKDLIIRLLEDQEQIEITIIVDDKEDKTA